MRSSAGRAAGARLRRGVDILVNNAATVEPLGVTAAIPAAELRRAFELNVIRRRADRAPGGRHRIRLGRQRRLRPGMCLAVAPRGPVPVA
jgi:NAD(P)-dependent dehydrogenase (short-subunit alcohol dehydrogenase family)